MGNFHSRKHLPRSCRLLLQLGFLLRIRAAESFWRTLKSEHAPRDLSTLLRLFHIIHRREHAEAVEQHGREHAFCGIHRPDRQTAYLLDRRYAVALQGKHPRRRAL